LGLMAPQSHPVLRSDMHSTETRIEPTTKNNATLRKTGPSFGMSVEGDVRFPAHRTLGIGWEITLRNGEIFLPFYRLKKGGENLQCNELMNDFQNLKMKFLHDLY